MQRLQDKEAAIRPRAEGKTFYVQRPMEGWTAVECGLYSQGEAVRTRVRLVGLFRLSIVMVPSQSMKSLNRVGTDELEVRWISSINT